MFNDILDLIFCAHVITIISITTKYSGYRGIVQGQAGPALLGSQRHFQEAPGTAHTQPRPQVLRNLHVQGDHQHYHPCHQHHYYDHQLRFMYGTF